MDANRLVLEQGNLLDPSTEVSGRGSACSESKVQSVEKLSVDVRAAKAKIDRILCANNLVAAEWNNEQPEPCKSSNR